MTIVEELANKVGSELKKNKLVLSTAESCTGGGLSYLITRAEGCSEWFDRGFITYSNPAKVEMLGVKESTLQNFGAVSAETAKEMAKGALDNSDADVSIAITGIAGPTGGSSEKPVGTVWLGWSSKNGNTEAELCYFSGDRDKIRELSVEKALKKILEVVKTLS